LTVSTEISTYKKALSQFATGVTVVPVALTKVL